MINFTITINPTDYWFNMLDFLSLVLYDYCKLHGFEFISADDILHSHDVNDEERIWLQRYIQVWDIISSE